MARRPSYRQLAEIRRQPDYYKGALIEEAASIAINVGRPPRREGTVSLGGSTAMRAHAQVDYASINERYESELAEQQAVGWAEDELSGDHPAQTLRVPEAPTGNEQVA